jgi:hypothetical protein
MPRSVRILPRGLRHSVLAPTNPISVHALDFRLPFGYSIRNSRYIQLLRQIHRAGRWTKRWRNGVFVVSQASSMRQICLCPSAWGTGTTTNAQEDLRNLSSYLLKQGLSPSVLPPPDSDCISGFQSP